jgi:hypothetical protein
MTNELTPAQIRRIKQCLPSSDTTNSIAAAINFFKHQLRLDLDFNAVEDTSGNHTVSVGIFGLILAKSEPHQKKKTAKENASTSLLDKLNALSEPKREAFIKIVCSRTTITEEEACALNDIIPLIDFEYSADEEYSAKKYAERSQLLTNPAYLKKAKYIYDTMSINKETESTDPLLALKTKPNYEEGLLQFTFEVFGISSLFKALPLRTPQNIKQYEDTTKLLLSKELSLNSISKEAIAHAYIQWFNTNANDKKIIEKFFSALKESELYLSSQENAQDRAKYYSETYLARLVMEINKYDEANMPDYFKEMIHYLNPGMIWENSVKSGNFIVYQLLSQSGTVDFSSYLNDEILSENINSLFQSYNDINGNLSSVFTGFSSIPPNFLTLPLRPKADTQALDSISLLMKLMKDINKMDIPIVEMIVSSKDKIQKKYVQEFIKCLLDKNYDFKTIMPTSLDLIRKTLLDNDHPELFAAMSNKYNLSEVPAEDIAVYVKELISSNQHYKADLLLTSGALVTKVLLEDIITVSRNLSNVFSTDNELYMSEMKKLFDLVGHAREYSNDLDLLGNHNQVQEHIDYSSPEDIYSQLG